MRFDRLGPHSIKSSAWGSEPEIENPVKHFHCCTLSAILRPGAIVNRTVESERMEAPINHPGNRFMPLLLSPMLPQVTGVRAPIGDLPQRRHGAVVDVV
jgi:hypothetical protein